LTEVLVVRRAVAMRSLTIYGMVYNELLPYFLKLMYQLSLASAGIVRTVTLPEVAVVEP